ncbi:MAG: bis(5'-nucleosyl)-tetraphosphatase (symmetrical) YqeK [Clostridia bacterium]|nr:bis(5'-nucleosyl)-tetraphosphatase (symmetrical) YqeK [Clostridia bacterium]
MYSEYIEILRSRLKPYRFEHSLNVADSAADLAEKYGADKDRAYLAGLLHDICKNDTEENQLQMFDEFGIILDSVQKSQPKLWHAISGAAYIKNVLNICDDEIISAIRYHTTAKADMTLLEKILYIADYISADRDYNGVDEMREAAYISIEKAMEVALQFTITDLSERFKPIHKDTLEAYNQICLIRKD